MSNDVDRLRDSLEVFAQEAGRILASPEGREFTTMVSGTVERLIRALGEGRVDDARLETLTFSRQLSDTYVEAPPSLAKVSAMVAEIRRRLTKGGRS